MSGFADRGSVDRALTEGELERRREEGSALVSEGARRAATFADLEGEEERSRAFAASIGSDVGLVATSSEGGRRALRRREREARRDETGLARLGDPEANGAEAPGRSLGPGSATPESATVWAPGVGAAPASPETASVDRPASPSRAGRDVGRVPSSPFSPSSTDAVSLDDARWGATPAGHDRAHRAVAAREAAGGGPSGSGGPGGGEGRGAPEPLASEPPSSLAGSASSPFLDRATELGGYARDAAGTAARLIIANAAAATLDSAASGGRDLEAKDATGYVAQRARDGAHAFRTSLTMGSSLRAASVSGAVAALGSDEIQEADAQVRRGVLVGRAGRRLVGAVGDGWRVGIADRIKHAYSKRLIGKIARKRAAGEVVVGQGAALRVESTLRAVGATASTAAKGGGLLAWLGAPVALVVILGLLIFALIMGAAAGSDEKIDGLGPYATQMAQYLRDAGWDDVHIAAAVGNAIYESGGDHEALEIDPAHEGDLSGVGHYGYEVNCGIFSWTDTSPGSGVMTTMKTYAQMNEREWQDLEMQLDFFLQVYLPGRNPAAVNRWFAISDLDEATEVMVSPSGGILSGWAGAVQGEVLETRLDLAHRVYAALTNGGGGEEYEASSEIQRAIADAARRVPSPGAGLCAMWVSQVYSAAGLGYIGGNADDMYYAYCTSSDLGTLKVGMLIGTPSNPYTPASQLYGHVGIYVGDGLVMSNLSGTVTTQTVEDFIAEQGVTHQVRWGFPPNVNI